MKSSDDGTHNISDTLNAKEPLVADYGDGKVNHKKTEKKRS